jgi:hypothetical protein
MYRVVLEEFRITDRWGKADPGVDHSLLLQDKAGSGFAVTVLLNACLNQLSEATDIVALQEDVWLVEWLAFPEEYAQVERILSAEGWPDARMAWFIGEFTDHDRLAEYRVVPFYLPAYGQPIRDPGREAGNSMARLLSSGY